MTSGVKGYRLIAMSKQAQRAIEIYERIYWLTQVGPERIAAEVAKLRAELDTILPPAEECPEIPA